MSLDVDTLTQELAEIYKRKEDVDETLNTKYSLRGRGRGRGPYGMGIGRGRGSAGQYPPDRPYRSYEQGERSEMPHDQRERPDQPYEQRGRPDRPDRPYDQRDRPDRQSEQLGPSQRGLPPHLQNRLSERAGPRGPPPDAELPVQASGRERERFAPPKVMSAVVVNGQARMPTQDAAPQQEPGIAKRPRETADSDNPAAVKRNRRMFAGLLGTLNQFKKDDEKFSQSGVAQQRAEARQRAEERAVEAERNARQAAREAFLSQRREEINKKRELEMQARAKKLEIGLAARITHHAKLFNFLKTAAGPSVLWLPAHISSGVQQMLEQRQSDFQTWQGEQQEDLEKQKTEMASRLQQTIARSVPHRFTRKPEEARPDQRDGQTEPAQNPEQDQDMDQAENGAEDGMEDAENGDGEEQRDSQEPDDGAVETLPSPVAPEVQDNPDVEDRYEGGGPSDQEDEQLAEAAEPVEEDS